MLSYLTILALSQLEPLFWKTTKHEIQSPICISPAVCEKNLSICYRAIGNIDISNEIMLLFGELRALLEN